MKDGLQGMMAQVQKAQENMQKMQEEIANLEVTGEAGAGMVSVVMNGRHEVKRVNIDPDVLGEDKEMLEDLLAAAVNDAVHKVESENREKMSGLASGITMPPGFDFKL